MTAMASDQMELILLAVALVAAAIGLAGLALWWRDRRRARKHRQAVERRLREIAGPPT